MKSPPSSRRTQIRYRTRGQILIDDYMADRLTTEQFVKAVDRLMRSGQFYRECPSMLDWAYRLPI